MKYIDDNGEKYVRNIIYQYWQGDLKPGVKYSTKLMKEYADRIGAEYRFDHNIQIASKTVNVPIYYEPANPLVDPSFDEYDNVALVFIFCNPAFEITTTPVLYTIGLSLLSKEYSIPHFLFNSSHHRLSF